MPRRRRTIHDRGGRVAGAESEKPRGFADTAPATRHTQRLSYSPKFWRGTAEIGAVIPPPVQRVAPLEWRNRVRLLPRQQPARAAGHPNAAGAVPAGLHPPPVPPGAGRRGRLQWAAPLARRNPALPIGPACSSRPGAGGASARPADRPRR